MRFVKVGAWVLFTLLILAIAVALIGQNTESLTVTLFSYTSSTIPKWALLLGCIFIGAFATTLFFIVELIILETKTIRYRRQIQLLERALAESGTVLTGDSSNDKSEPKTSLSEDVDDLSDV